MSNPASSIGHKAISASAGSGKTFQLAHRYIRLLMAGVAPDRIVALTFSRKAAGEIFDGIMDYLCRAAGDPAAAAAMSTRIGEELDQGAYLEALGRVIRAMHRLRIGTLDGFTVGVVRAFPMELGVAPGFDVMDSDGAAAALARAEVLHELFDPRRIDPRDQDEFIEAFKQSTFGREEKRLLQSLDQFVTENQSAFRGLPDAAAWGAVKRIWPAGSRWLNDPGPMEAVVLSCRALIEAEPWSDATKRKWMESIEAMARHQPGSPWTSTVKYLPERLLPGLDALVRGNLSIKIMRGVCDVPPPLCRELLALLTHVMAVELATTIEQTRGMGRVLQQFEILYDTLVRRRGRLTFDDAQLLLTRHNRVSGGKVMSSGSDAPGRLQIDYRLDGRLDHWLIDEFQDTSNLQWDVLSNLIDEVIQDAEQRRSFFYVGDVKQAIYGWRGGNPRLFREILDRYAGAIEEEPLDCSYRSCLPVIDTVNRVFEALPADRLTPGALELWSATWSSHSCAEGMVPATGFAALLEVESENNRDTAGDRFDVAARLVSELDPVRRGLSIALLVRTNDAGRRLADVLRASCPDIPVVHEGRAVILDNPVVAVLLSVLRAAAHPGDSLAWQHLCMSPLSHWLDRHRVDASALTLHVLGDLNESGFRDVLARWSSRIESITPLDGFGRKRVRELLTAAGEFDELGSRDVNEFTGFIESYRVREPTASRGAVRVMTIHQSKGLGFDVVILPDLEDTSLVGGGTLGLAVEADWALRLPRRLVAQHDEILESRVRRHDVDRCFESLCVLYVALTRAKQGLYMISGRGGKDSTTLYPIELLKQQLVLGPGETMILDGRVLDCRYAEGDPEWYLSCGGAEAQPEAVPESASRLSGRASRRAALLRVAPSGLDVREENAGELFGSRRKEIFDYGTAMHSLFEQVAWLDACEPEQVLAAWMETYPGPEGLKKSMAEPFRRAVADGAIAASLSRPDSGAVLWREKAFEIVMENEWVSGTFDRVTIVPGGAYILDYKTNRVTTEEEIAQAAEHYRGQLELYQCALAAILGIEPESIRLQLLFTSPGRLVELR